MESQKTSLQRKKYIYIYGTQSVISSYVAPTIADAHHIAAGKLTVLRLREGGRVHEFVPVYDMGAVVDVEEVQLSSVFRVWPEVDR